MRRSGDFSRRAGERREVPLYDTGYDAVLIEQSIATQYGVLPAAQGELPYPEWAKLVAGLMDDTPLGRVVAVRGEKDAKALARMSGWQKQIRAEWKRFLARREAERHSPAELREEMAVLERQLALAFGDAERKGGKELGR